MAEHTRLATAGDVAAMEALILAHGPNQWNYLPEPSVRSHLCAMASGAVLAAARDVGGRVVGFATFVLGTYPSGPVERTFGDQVAFITEVVVAFEHRRQGIGASLLEHVVEFSAGRSLRAVYIDRHADNLPSARMMERAGFRALVRYPDPERRVSGTRDTVVCIREMG